MALDTASKLLGAPVRFRLTGARPGPPEDALPPDGRPVVVAVIDDAAGHLWVAEIDQLLAAVVVDRALGGDGNSGIGRGVFPADEFSKGVLAYVLARLLAPSGQCLCAIDVRPERISSLKRSAPCDAGACFEVWVEPVRGHVQLWTSASAWSSCGAPQLPPARLPDTLARTLPFALAADAGQAQLELSELRSLLPGDILVPDACALCRVEDGWRGRAELSLGGTKHTHCSCHVHDEALVIERVLRVQDGAMGDSKSHEAEQEPFDPLVPAGDTPIELRVELARFHLTLAELAALQPGQVLSTGRRIGEHVVLRAGPAAMATGELVDIEGEVGVRIVRVAEDPAAAS
ncbi:MAG: type III secretion system cytoplasmic ring protein SctQ [Proteobacteria bacterium]|nr:type III secretion system cytoplasmic ring protein SctQ [Pseudomonadota bacterium]